MDREFSWNLRGPSQETLARDAAAYNAAQAAAALAGAMPAGAAQASLDAREAQKLQAQLDEARQVQQDEAALQARQARWLALEDKFAGRSHDPRMKMAAMLAMAGQPGALQAALSTNLSGKASEDVQKEMDSLESSIANDMFALAGADNDTYDKLTAALIPIYRSKFDELIAKGARSRMGASWDEGWGAHLGRQEKTRKNRKAKEAQKKAEAKKAVDNY